MQKLRAFLLLCGTLISPLAWCQGASPPKYRAVLVLVIDQPTRPFARDLLEGVHESTRDATGLSVFVEFSGPIPLESAAVAAQRRQTLMTRYAGQPIEIVVAIGDRILPEADRLRNELFPKAKLLFVVSFPETVRQGLHQGEGLHVDVSPVPSLEVARSLMPGKSQLVVVSGRSALDQRFRQLVAASLPDNIHATYLDGVPLPDLLNMVPRFPVDSMLVVTTNMVDRSGRATSNSDLARELSTAGRVPIVEGSDLSLGQGSLGGDIASYRLTGKEIGKRIRRTLDTGQAPAGVVLDPAPRRKALDWRQLKRFGIPENRVPQGFEVLYRQPTIWEEHRGAILATGGGLLVQWVLISFLLAERRRRAEAQQRMERRLTLEAMVSKASGDLSMATHGELPARLRDVSVGLCECIGIERVSIWVYVPEARDYAPLQWWPESKQPAKGDAIARRFPFLLGELLAGRTLNAASLDDPPFGTTPDAAELRARGFVSLLMIPLKLGDSPVGALFLGTYNHMTNWDSEALSTLQVLANVLANGISRTAADERMRQSEEQNRAMLASLPGFVQMIDGSGKILKQNNRLDLTESSMPRALAQSVIGRNLLDLWREEGDSNCRVAESLEAVIRGDEISLAMEHRYETQEGVRWIEVHAERLCGEQAGAVVSLTDITERKQKENESAHNRQTVWHLNRVAALGELTASLAHEINQPLGAILSTAEAAAQMLIRPSPDIAETLEAVHEIIEDDKRAGAVIARMRSMLKRGPEETQAVDLSNAVNETLRLVSSEARLRHVLLRHVATPDLPPVVADPTQLQQVILNLITNGFEAVEVMPEHRKVEIRTASVPPGDMQIIEVRDSGPGIPHEKLTTIFEPFYTSKREGLGLGLSICRSIVDSFGGRISVESPPDGGAIFRVFLRTFARSTAKTSQAFGARA